MINVVKTILLPGLTLQLTQKKSKGQISKNHAKKNPNLFYPLTPTVVHIREIRNGKFGAFCFLKTIVLISFLPMI